MKKSAVLFLCLLILASAAALTLHRRGNYTFDVAAKTNPAPLASTVVVDPNADIGPQSPLAVPPQVIKAAYVTSWAAGSQKKVAYLARILKDTELNAVVIDVKDFTGTVSYITDVADVKKYNAQEKRIPRVNALIKTLHDAGVYVIGRIAVFEDQKLPLARPELALQSKKTGTAWKDYKGIMWLDTAAPEVWDYNIAIAKDALARGFDEVNFDYIRFASDGNLADIGYPVWDMKTPKREVVRRFWAYLREHLGEAKMSADLFGMTTTNNDDLNIGQYFENALPYFDAIAPMVYPSHYTTGFIGYKNPALAPYEVVRYSLDKAIERMKKYETVRAEIQKKNQLASASAVVAPVPPPIRARLRPWLQDFDLGATYDAEKVQAEFRATTDAAWGCANVTPQAPAVPVRCDGTIHSEAMDGRFVNGWMLWNPSSTYTQEALQMETAND